MGSTLAFHSHCDQLAEREPWVDRSMVVFVDVVDADAVDVDCGKADIQDSEFVDSEMVV